MQVSCPGCARRVSDRAPGCRLCGRVAGRASAASGDASVVHHLAAAADRAHLLPRQKRYSEAVATLDRTLALAPASAFVRSATAVLRGGAR
ncbi:MAG TPA: hypothetical protein VGB87_09905 [Vicinamibacteria bacterium]